jgi:hypothetical protein
MNCPEKERSGGSDADMVPEIPPSVLFQLKVTGSRPPFWASPWPVPVLAQPAKRIPYETRAVARSAFIRHISIDYLCALDGANVVDRFSAAIPARSSGEGDRQCHAMTADAFSPLTFQRPATSRK